MPRPCCWCFGAGWMIENRQFIRCVCKIKEGEETLPLPTVNSTVEIKDPAEGIKYPNLDLKVFIVNGAFRTGAIAMFARAGCTRAEKLEDADLCVFLGGEDVHPSLYGEKPEAGCYYNEARDDHEKQIFERCLEEDIPMFGICRGMQLIHALTDSKLYQDVDNHGRSHDIIDTETKETIRASSMHHQMCIPDGKQIAVAFSVGVATRYAGPKKGKTTYSNGLRELEAAHYPAHKAFCVQGHPEVPGYDRFTVWCLEHIERLVYESTETYNVAQALPEKIGIR